jgi:hypothetical protein
MMTNWTIVPMMTNWTIVPLTRPVSLKKISQLAFVALVAPAFVR